MRMEGRLPCSPGQAPATPPGARGRGCGLSPPLPRGCCTSQLAQAPAAWLSPTHICLLGTPAPSLEAEPRLGAAEPVLCPLAGDSALQHLPSHMMPVTFSSLTIALWRCSCPTPVHPVPERQELDSLPCHPCSTATAQAGDSGLGKCPLAGGQQ